MKKILFVSPTGTLDNGAEKSILNLMVSLTNQGYRVFNVYPSNEHATAEAYETFLTHSGIYSFPLKTIKWWWEEFPLPSLTSEYRFRQYQTNLYEIRQIIRQEKIDLVISNTANVFQGAIAAACENVAHFWLIHEFPSGEFAYYKDKLPFLVENSDALFAVQGNLTHTLDHLLGEPSLVSSFIPFSQVGDSPLKVGSERRIVSVGQLNENKNQLELLKAYHLQHLELPLVFIGGWVDEYKKKCDQYIQEHQLKNVYFLGNHEDPWELVTDQDICVYTSQSESFSMVYIESVLKGIPVLVSNNMGYQSAKQFVGIGEMYELGNLSQLQEKLADLLEHFTVQKEAALAQASVVGQRYTVENCYEAIVEAIENTTFRPKKQLASIQSLLGSYNPARFLSQVGQQKVTIFFGQDGEFSESNKCDYPLETSDEIRITIPKECKSIRIDLSELPSFYYRVSLVDLTYQTEVLPVHTNALVLGNRYIFPHHDPQLVYDIYEQQGREFLLSYQMYNIEDIHSEDYIGKVFAQEVKQLETKIVELTPYKASTERLEEENEYLRKELEDMVIRYNSVTHSRRWTIPTKMIDFFKGDEK